MCRDDPLVIVRVRGPTDRRIPYPAPALARSRGNRRDGRGNHWNRQGNHWGLPLRMRDSGRDQVKGGGSDRDRVKAGGSGPGQGIGESSVLDRIIVGV